MKLSHRLAAGAVALTTIAAVMPAAFAQSSTATPTGNPAACSAAIDARHATMLTRMEEQFALRKTSMNTMHDAMKAALLITDPAARKEALRAARENAREGMKDFHDGMEEERTDDIDTLKNACGDLLPARQGGGKPFGHGRRGGWHMGR